MICCKGWWKKRQGRGEVESDRICLILQYDLRDPGMRVRKKLKIDWAQGLGEWNACGGGFVSEEY